VDYTAVMTASYDNDKQVALNILSTENWKIIAEDYGILPENLYRVL